MAVSNPSGLTLSSFTTGIKYSKVTDSSSDWSGVSNSTYFYDKSDGVVYYKDLSGRTLSMFSSSGLTEAIQFAASDETTAITTGTSKVTIRAPYAMTITEVRASLTTAQTSGNTFTADIKVNGSSILSTLITIDNTEKTSKTAATLPVLSSTSLADDAEIKVDVTQVGSGDATGLKLTILGYKV